MRKSVVSFLSLAVATFVASNALAAPLPHSGAGYHGDMPYPPQGASRDPMLERDLSMAPRPHREIGPAHDPYLSSEFPPPRQRPRSMQGGIGGAPLDPSVGHAISDGPIAPPVHMERVYVHSDPRLDAQREVASASVPVPSATSASTSVPAPAMNDAYLPQTNAMQYNPHLPDGRQLYHDPRAGVAPANENVGTAYPSTQGAATTSSSSYDDTDHSTHVGPYLPDGKKLYSDPRSIGPTYEYPSPSELDAAYNKEDHSTHVGPYLPDGKPLYRDPHVEPHAVGGLRPYDMSHELVPSNLPDPKARAHMRFDPNVGQYVPDRNGPHVGHEPRPVVAQSAPGVSMDPIPAEQAKLNQASTPAPVVVEPVAPVSAPVANAPVAPEPMASASVPELRGVIQGDPRYGYGEHVHVVRTPRFDPYLYENIPADVYPSTRHPMPDAAIRGDHHLPWDGYTGPDLAPSAASKRSLPYY